MEVIEAKTHSLALYLCLQPLTHNFGECDHFVIFFEPEIF